jgi:hypothetical protein
VKYPIKTQNQTALADLVLQEYNRVMAVKLYSRRPAERELDITLVDNYGVERALVAELASDGTVKLRLKGMKRTVTVNLLGALGIDNMVMIQAGQPMTAKKRTFLEHLRGR